MYFVCRCRTWSHPVFGCNDVLLIYSFKKLRERRLRETEEQQQKLLQLQNGQVSPSPEEESPQRIMGLDLSTWEDRSYEQRGRSVQILSGHDGTVREEEEEVERINARSEERPSVGQAEEPESILTSTVVVRERSRTVDEPSQKNTRAKRESRRMRELEQAKFSLELLKVRANSGGASSPSEERRWSLELMPTSTSPLRSPQGTPDSQSSKGSFELLNMDEEAPKASEEATDSEDPCSPPPPPLAPESMSPEPAEPHRTGVTDAVLHPGSHSRTEMDLAALPATTHPPKIENYLPTFYVPTSEGSTFSPRRPTEEPQKTEVSVSTATATVSKLLKERRDSGRRPVVVVISMQKETPLSEELGDLIRPPVEVRDSGAQTGELSPPLQKADTASAPPGPEPVSTSTPQADTVVLQKLVRLNEQKEERQRNQRQQDEKEMMEQIRQQKEVLERQRLYFAQCERDMLEKQRDEALQRIQQSREAGQDADRTAASRKPLRPNSLLLERTAGLAPHARTQSDSTAPSRGDAQGRAPHLQLPPPPASAPRERRRPTADGWAPNLTLESKDRAANRARAANKKPSSSQASSVSMMDKSGKIFFSPRDKVTFTK